MARKPKGPKQVGTLNYEKDVRRNIPTAEMADLAAMQEEMAPLQPVAYLRARPLTGLKRGEPMLPAFQFCIWVAVLRPLSPKSGRGLGKMFHLAGVSCCAL